MTRARLIELQKSALTSHTPDYRLTQFQAISRAASGGYVTVNLGVLLKLEMMGWEIYTRRAKGNEHREQV